MGGVDLMISTDHISHQAILVRSGGGSSFGSLWTYPYCNVYVVEGLLHTCRHLGLAVPISTLS